MTDARATVPTVPGLTGLSVLARGGYATVYRAVQESVGRDVAVKVENRRLESERDQRRFLREARAAGRMSGHPNVIDLFDAGVTGNGHPFLIMELCEGTYAERMRTNPLSAAEARDVGVKIADALADAHALGVLHRDVKPANLLISRFGEPQLADFGLAILAEARDHSITLDVLTPAYAPPEMFRYTEPVPASDVYGLCATLYALMWGRPPRWRDDVSPSLMSLFEMFGEPIPDVPGVPANMMALLRGGMHNDEKHRPLAVEIRDALLALDLEPGGSAVPTRRPAFGPPSRGPSETSSRGWPANPSDFAGDNERTQPKPAPAPPAARPVSPAKPPPRSAEFRPGVLPGPAATAIGARRWLWWGIAAACLALVTMVGGVGLALAGHQTVRGPQTPAPTTAPSPASSGTAAGSGCALGAASPTLRCATTPQCFGTLAIQNGIARAGATPCDQPHAWEVFAMDDLPTGLTALDYATVKSRPPVSGACSVTTLVLVDFDVSSWRVDVLPPAPDAYRAGDRTYRCVAGPRTGTATGSKFAKPS